MLEFDPKKRIRSEDALTHYYLASYHYPANEPVAEAAFDWSSCPADLPVDTWKTML